MANTKQLKYTAADLDDSITKFKDSFRNVSNVNVTANDMAAGKIAVNKDQEIIGTLREASGIIDSNNITDDKNASRVILGIPEDGIYKNAQLAVDYSQLADTLEINSASIIEGSEILGIQGTGKTGSDVEQGDGILFTDNNGKIVINHGNTSTFISGINNTLVNRVATDKFGHITDIGSVAYAPLTEQQITSALTAALNANK